MVVDHVVPFIHPKLSGLHVLGNLQYLTRRDNNRKGNRLDCTDAEMEEHVRYGIAVWTKDVGEDGKVDWLWYQPAGSSEAT